MKHGEFMRDRWLGARRKSILAGIVLVMGLMMASLAVSASGNGGVDGMRGSSSQYDEVFMSVEKMPVFPGGEAALMTYVRDNIS